MGTSFGGAYQQLNLPSQSQHQHHQQSSPQQQLSPNPFNTTGNIDRTTTPSTTNYNTFHSDRFDLGYSESDYPIKDDETNYCSSKHPKINFFFFTSFYVVFLMFGAIVFLIIEQPREIESRDKLIEVQENFLSKYPHVEVLDVKNLLQVLLKAQNEGYYVPIVGTDLVIDEELTNIAAVDKNAKVVNLKENTTLPSTEPLPETTTVKLTEQSATVSIQNVAKPSFKSKTKRLNEMNSRTDKSSTSPTSTTLDLSETVTKETPVAYEMNNNHENTTANKTLIKLKMIKPITKWRFSSSLLFVTSLVTTVGYGNLTPLTVTGKISCIIFCIIGVPSTLTFFSTLVTIFVRGPVKRVEAWIIGVIINLHRSATVFMVRILHLTIITTFLSFVCLFLPAYFFYLNEDGWTYLEAFYCCFISLTTIGLGDFVPGIEGTMADLLYPFIIVIYLFFGLSMIMVWLSLIHRIPQLNLSDALVADDKEEDQAAEEENNRNRERLRILTNQLIIQHKLKQLRSSIRLQESNQNTKINQSVIP